MSGNANNAMDLYRAVFDSIPSLAFIVNSDCRITQYNAAVAKLFDGGAILQRRVGEIMNCLYSTDPPDGCGSGSFCRDCIVGNAISEAFHGSQVVRRRTTIEVLSDGKKAKICALISVTPFHHLDKPLARLMIEDMEETDKLRPFIAVCSGCRKVRNEHGAWLHMEAYFKDMDFSHGYCPDCLNDAATNIKKQIMAAMDDGAADEKRGGALRMSYQKHIRNPSVVPMMTKRYNTQRIQQTLNLNKKLGIFIPDHRDSPAAQHVLQGYIMYE